MNLKTRKQRHDRLAQLAGREPYSEPFDDLGEFLSCVVAAADSGRADRRLEFSAAATGANESIPSEGGFVLPPEIAGDIWARALDTGELLRRVTRIPVGSTDGLKIPAIDETSRASGSRWGGVQSAWVDASATVAESKPKFQLLTLKPHKNLGIAYATDELVADSAALGRWFELAFTDEIVHQLEQAIVDGTGAGQPLGILNSGALVTVAKESGQAAATAQPANFSGMMKRLWGPGRRRSVWITSVDVLGQVEGGQFANGTPAVRYDADGEPTIMGRPVLLTEYTPSLGAAGDVILFDPAAYAVAERAMDFVSSLHVRFIYDEMTFRVRLRADGQPLWRSTIVPKNSSVAQSPFVALAARE